MGDPRLRPTTGAARPPAGRCRPTRAGGAATSRPPPGSPRLIILARVPGHDVPAKDRPSRRRSDRATATRTGSEPLKCRRTAPRAGAAPLGAASGSMSRPQCRNHAKGALQRQHRGALVPRDRSTRRDAVLAAPPTRKEHSARYATGRGTRATLAVWRCISPPRGRMSARRNHHRPGPCACCAAPGTAHTSTDVRVKPWSPDVQTSPRCGSVRRARRARTRPGLGVPQLRP